MAIRGRVHVDKQSASAVRAAGPRRRLLGSAPLLLAALLVAVVVATIGRPLVGLGSLHAADTLRTLDPWRQTAPEGFRPDNGTVSDTVDTIAPLRLAVAERARDGDLALWSSTQGGGAPALGVPNTAMFSPLNLPWWLAPGHAAPALAKLLQMLVAAGGLFLFARRLGVSRTSALVGALAFVNAGHLVVWTTWPQSNVAALVPWLLWAVDRGATGEGASDWWPVPLVGAAMWLEGFPALALWAHALAGTWALARGGWPVGTTVAAADPVDRVGAAGGAALLPRRAPGRLRTGTGAVLAMLVGLAVAAVQLVPFVLRVQELSLGEARAAKAVDALPWESLATVVSARALGASGEGVWYGPRNEVELQAFAGVGALALVVVAVAWGPRLSAPAGWRRWWAGWLAVLAAAIWTGPGNDVVQLLPVVGSNQTGRLRGLVAVLLAVMVALGHQALADRGEWAPPEQQRRRLVTFGLLGLLAAAAAVPLWRAGQQSATAGRDDFTTAVVVPLVLVAVVVVGLIALAQVDAPRWRRVALLLLPVVIAVEGVAFARAFLPRIDREDFYPRTAAHDVVADLVGSNRFAAGGLALYPGTTTAYGLRSVTAHAGMPRGWRSLVEAADPEAFARNSTFPILDTTAEVAASSALDLLGATHFVLQESDRLLGTIDPPQPLSRPVATGRTINGVDVGGGVLELLADQPLPATLVVRIVRDDGTTVARGERRVSPRDRAPFLPVAVVAVDGAAPPTGGRVEVAIQLNAPVRGRPAPDFRPAVTAPDDTLVRAVRVGDDDLRVVAEDGVVVYERPDALPRVRLRNLDAGTAEVLVDADDETVVEVRTPSRTTLVIADARSGGHRATVDGRPAAVRTVDGAFIGVDVPEGTHRVRVWFEPEGFRAGATLTVLGLLGTWLAGMRARRRAVARRRSHLLEQLQEGGGTVGEGVAPEDGAAPQG